MLRPGGFLLGCLSILVCLGSAGGASEQAMTLRASGGLSPCVPSATFLSSNFVADEVEPTYIFGRVADFAQTRACPTTWLIEEGEQKRIGAAGQSSAPMEYSLYLEEDCSSKVTRYVFVDRSQADSVQWMEWRKQFHKSKADPQYGAVKAVLEDAARNGFSVGAELRFVIDEDSLVLRRPEDILLKELKLQPLYDLKQGKPFVP